MFVPDPVQDAAARMTRSARAESSFSYNDADRNVRLRYEHTWTDLPDTLVPGQPFNIRLTVNQLERSMPLDKAIFGPNTWITGVMVTAGKDYITKVLQDSSPIRIESNLYRLFDPSPQLCLSKDTAAGFIEVGRTPAPEYLMNRDWVESGSVVFDDPVTDKIPNKDTFEVPAENIDGELMLVVIQAIGFNSWIYVDVNYLYYFEKNRRGGGIWKLRTQFVTTNFAADVKFTGGGTTGKAKIELK